MELNEIEAQAETLTQRLTDETTGRQEALLLGVQIEGLKDLAEIKTLRRRVLESEEFVQLQLREIAAMEQVAAAVPRQVAAEDLAPLPWHPLDDYKPAKETKPAVDRLHKLVSYLKTRAGECYTRGDQEPALEGQHRNTAKAYDDAATKLDEILREGEL